MDPIKKDDYKRLVRLAFKKIKSYVYYDKTTLELRNDVVDFEIDEKFEENLDSIAQAYDNGLSADSDFMKEILESISVLSFPKKCQNNKTKDQNSNCADDSIISVGNPNEKPIVSENQHFIKMSVEGHILGILWIFAFGKILEDKCYKNSYGNRLNTSLIWGDDNKIIDTPTLFEPYFNQYSLWRDNGLKCAEELLDKGHDVLLLTLDFTKFYYNAGLSKKVFDEIPNYDTNGKDKTDDRDIQLNDAIFTILEKYTELLKEKEENMSGVVLPIGFLPSGVIANWSLNKFDLGIIDYWNPIYYGRYVDDIIIVEKIEKDSDIYVKARENNLNKDYVIEFYLKGGRRKNSDSFIESVDNKAKEGIQEKKPIVEESVLEEGNISEKHYKVVDSYCLTKETNLVFQSVKTRIIALFADNNSKALLHKFKDNIFENVSEFRFMPDLEESFSKEDFSSFYRIYNDATINKLRGIKEISLDKFELSKFLGKYGVVSSLVDDKKDFTKVIGKMFNDREIVENYTLWERIFEIFITSKDYQGLIDFNNKIDQAIGFIDLGELLKKDKEGIISNLKNHKKFSLQRVLTLLKGYTNKKSHEDPPKEPINENSKKEKYINKSFSDEIFKISLLKDIINENSKEDKYITTRMLNNHIAALPTELLSRMQVEKQDDVAKINLTDFDEALNLIRMYYSDNDKIDKENAENEKTEINRFDFDFSDNDNSDKYIYAPYYVQSYDKIFSKIVEKLCSNDTVNPDFCFKTLYATEIKEVSFLDQQATNGTYHSPAEPNKIDLINVNDIPKSKLRIAIANVDVSKVSDLKSKLKGNNQTKSYKRYQNLSKIINDAITEKADFLVLPESYVPVQWLRTLAYKAAQVDMAIVTGVEHVIINKNVYNFTAVILPDKFYSNIPTASMFLQLKKHYAPEEERVIKSYRHNPINESGDRPLYRWKDCYFPVYCCYELTSITDRAEFMSWADMAIAVEYNKDTKYFSNIVESSTRDLHCFFVQANTSNFGDSRITQPTKSESQNLISIKGGLNNSILIGEVDIQSLREFQLADYQIQKDGIYKPTPPGLDPEIVRVKINKSL